MVTLADCAGLHSHHLALTVATLPYIGASVGICYADASDLRPVAEIGKETHSLLLITVHVQVVNAENRVGYGRMMC